MKTKLMYYVTVSSLNKKLNIQETIKYAITARSKEEAMFTAQQYGEVLYVDVKTYELGVGWE